VFWKSRSRALQLSVLQLRYNELDFEFHQTLAKATRNHFFMILLTALSDAFQGAWSHTHNRAENRGHGIEMHERILNAVRAHDSAAARQATRENLSAFLVDAIADEDSEMTEGYRIGRTMERSALEK
jgi:DNA-binding FadR family transcriptional regulator